MDNSDQELAGRTIETGLKQQFPLMEPILDDRYEDLENLLEKDHREANGELPIAVYSVIALRGMDPDVEDPEAANVLAQVVETLSEDLQVIWGKVPAEPDEEPPAERTAKPDAVELAPIPRSATPQMSDETRLHLIIGSEEMYPILQIGSPRLDELALQSESEEARVEQMFEGLRSICRGVSGPDETTRLVLMACTPKGKLYGVYDASTRNGFLCDQAAFAEFLADVREGLLAREAVASIEIPEGLPMREL